MDISKFLITTRPEDKYEAIPLKNIKIINIPLTGIKRNKMDEKEKNLLIQDNPDIVVLTSSYGAKIFFEYYFKFFKSEPVFIAIGESTADIITKYCHDPVVPGEKNSYGVIDLLKNYKKNKIALFRSNRSNEIIRNFLETHGYNYHEYFIYSIEAIYNNRIKEYITSENCMGILFTSSMEVDVFFTITGEINKPVYAIGKITGETLGKYNYNPIIFNNNSNFKNIVKKIDQNIDK